MRFYFLILSLTIGFFHEIWIKKYCKIQTVYPFILGVMFTALIWPLILVGLIVEVVFKKP